MQSWQHAHHRLQLTTTAGEPRATSPPCDSAGFGPLTCSPTAPAKPRSPAPWAPPARPPWSGTDAGRPAAPKHCKAPAAPVRQPARPGRTGPAGRRPRARLRHRPVDAGPRRPGDRAGDRLSYHPGHVWRLLRWLGWTPQRPARRATERDEEQIARWIAEDWP